MSDRGSVESFAHRTAKNLVVGWLRAVAEAAGPDNYVDFWGLGWRVNRGAPHFGVWEEYPIISDGTGCAPVWDEMDPRWRNRPPNYDELVNIGLRPMAILDIAVQHKGNITVAIEIKHKHACDARKLGFLRLHTSVLEVPAYWALGQIDTPTEIPDEFWIVR